MTFINPDAEAAEGIKNITASCNASISDHCFFVTTGDAANVTITLPNPLVVNNNQGMRIFIKKIDAGSKTVVINANTNSSTIDGSNTCVLSVQYAGIEIVSNGLAWYCVGDSRSAKTAGYTGNVDCATTAVGTFNNGVLVSVV